MLHECIQNFAEEKSKKNRNSTDRILWKIETLENKKQVLLSAIK
jgi:hypothetical protein